MDEDAFAEKHRLRDRRRRSSMSEEPTNLYVKNLPKYIDNVEKLKEIFEPFGTILQSKVQQDGIAFVRYSSHEEALQVMFHALTKGIGPCQAIYFELCLCLVF